MPKLPRATGREMVRFLEQQGFVIARIRGSHHVMESGPVRTTVPVHANRALHTGTLRAILRDINITPAEFEKLFHQQT